MSEFAGPGQHECDPAVPCTDQNPYCPPHLEKICHRSSWPGRGRRSAASTAPWLLSRRSTSGESPSAARWEVEADRSDVDYVIMGQVLQAGVGQIPARQAAVGAGIAMDVPALTMNKVCLSGLEAIALADKLIRAGEFTTVVAGGMESMSRAPHLLTGSRAGLKYGDVNLIDHLALDGLHDAFTDVPMGELTEAANDVDVVSRQEQDAFAARSHQRAAAAIVAGLFTPEIEPVLIRTRHGEILIDTDEGVRADNTVKTLAALRPSFRKDGTITAGSASQISDGAAAVIVMDKAEAERRGLDWIAEIGAHGSIAGPDSTLQDKPARAIQKACEKAGIDPDRSGPGRDQRGIRLRWNRIHPGARHQRGAGQRQRRRDRARPPHRRVRRPAGAAPGTGTAAPWRRHRRRRPVWRRRSRRCAAGIGAESRLNAKLIIASQATAPVFDSSRAVFRTESAISSRRSRIRSAGPANPIASDTSIPAIAIGPATPNSSGIVSPRLNAIPVERMISISARIRACSSGSLCFRRR